jgi:aryl-alcohol dehydrogenase-like predicted oxidoreductase
MIELAIRWILEQPGITAALCGAKRPDQIRESAGGSDWNLTAEQLDAIERALAERGAIDVRGPLS